MPDYLTYSPSCEAYIETTLEDGSKRFYDISPDITHLNVSRNVDSSSTFSITLSNKGRKYNGLFTAMDRIVLYATKTKRYRLLTGYITSTDVFTLYASDFHISGKCSLYQLQRMYWDPGLSEVVKELGGQFSLAGNTWLGAANLAYLMMKNVGGWRSDSIKIAEMPTSIEEWARELYATQRGDVEQTEAMLKSFDKMLHSSALQIAGGSSGAAGSSNIAYDGLTNLEGNEAQQAVVKLYISWEGRFVYSQSPGRLDPVANGYGDCSSTICAAYKIVTGMTIGTYTGDMIGNGILIAKGSGQLPVEKMEPGDCVFMNWEGFNPTYDHVELYVGDNQLSGHGGGMGPTRKQNAKAYGTQGTDWQVRRYVGSGTGK